VTPKRFPRRRTTAHNWTFLALDCHSLCQDNPAHPFTSSIRLPSLFIPRITSFLLSFIAHPLRPFKLSTLSLRHISRLVRPHFPLLNLSILAPVDTLSSLASPLLARPHACVLLLFLILVGFWLLYYNILGLVSTSSTRVVLSSASRDLIPRLGPSHPHSRFSQNTSMAIILLLLCLQAYKLGSLGPET
jgi:hypothetical protein